MVVVGVTRRIDDLGRITIPSEIRKTYQLDKNDPVEIIGTEDGILLRVPNNLKPEKPIDEDEEDPVTEGAETPTNYDLVAFEWVDAHIVELNARCNDAIGEGIEEMIIGSEELPVKASWPAICKELIKNDLTDVVCIDQGIKINLTQ